MKEQNFYRQLTDVCHTFLLKEKPILDYLINRNINKNIIKKYKLGYFPNDLRKLFEYISPKSLVDHQIIWSANLSPFKNYPLVVPIRNVYGEEIAIGCRTLFSESDRKEKGIPKYRNSSYIKGAHLFGLDYAVNTIRNNDAVYITEGYFDVISAQSQGIQNTVGTCGTALSVRQISMLSRYTNNINIIFDNDDAGKVAALRALDKFKNKNINIKIIQLPQEYKDLDEYITKTGMEII